MDTSLLQLLEKFFIQRQKRVPQLALGTIHTECIPHSFYSYMALIATGVDNRRATQITSIYPIATKRDDTYLLTHRPQSKNDIDRSCASA